MKSNGRFAGGVANVVVKVAYFTSIYLFTHALYDWLCGSSAIRLSKFHLIITVTQLLMIGVFVGLGAAFCAIDSVAVCRRRLRNCNPPFGITVSNMRESLSSHLSICAPFRTL